MRKISLMLLMLMIYIGSSTVFAMETVPKLQPSAASWYHNNVIFTKGQITEVDNNRIRRVRVEGDGGYKDIILNVSDITQIVNAESGAPVVFASLQKGDNVTAYYGPGVSKSQPPQGNAFALVVGTPDNGSAGIYMKAGRIQKQDDDESIKVLSSNGDRVITITRDIFPDFDKIRQGSDLMVWYDIITTSLPGQASATKAVLLPATLKVYLSDGVIVINGQEIAPTQEESIIKRNKTVILPLRKIVENLGYKIVWDSKQQQIELKDGAETVATCKIGSNIYYKKKTVIGLANVPELINGKMFVPLNFFSDVLDIKVADSYNHF